MYSSCSRSSLKHFKMVIGPNYTILSIWPGKYKPVLIYIHRNNRRAEPHSCRSILMVHSLLYANVLALCLANTLLIHSSLKHFFNATTIVSINIEGAIIDLFDIKLNLDIFYYTNITSAFI